MRVLHAITSLYTGGAESLVAQITPRFAARGIETEVALFNGADTPFRRQLEDSGIKVHSFGAGSVYNPLHIFRLRKLMKDFDIVHTHNYAPQIFGALAKFGRNIELITTEHGGSNRRRSWRWFAPIDRWMYSRYDKVICISEKAEESLRLFIKSDSERIVTVLNGIDTVRYANAEPLDDFKPDGVKAITMVAGFRWEKDQDTLIRAMKLLPNEFHLYLVGDGVRRAECESLAASEGVSDRVHFLGIRTDVPRILKSSDYIAMSSHFEGLSLSSVEGMAARKPMFASDVDGLREVVGGAGILFEHQNPKDFANKIMELHNSPEKYGIVAKRCSEKATQYDIEKMVESYQNIYETVNSSSLL